MAAVREQDPVREEEGRKDAKPEVSVRVARRLAQEHYSLAEPTVLARFLHLFFDRKRTKISALNSYDDKNFLFYERHVVKFYNGVESGWPAFIEAQGEAMRRLKSCGILCSTPVLSKAGQDYVSVALPNSRDKSSSEGRATRKHAMRVLTFIPGKILADVSPQTESLLVETGKLIGKVDRAFEGFDHPGFHRNHMWDLKHSLRLREFVHNIQGESRRRLVSRVLDEFEKDILPVSGDLRETVIHNDANDQNILTDERGTRVIGVVDMGDMVRTWRVAEIAIAMAYIMLDKVDILRDASLLLAGYCKVCPLEEKEVEVLRTLVACRLACSSTMSAYSSSKEPENEYLVITQEPGWKCLEAFVEMSQEDVLKAFVAASKGEVPGCLVV